MPREPRLQGAVPKVGIIGARQTCPVPVVGVTLAHDGSVRTGARVAIGGPIPPLLLENGHAVQVATKAVPCPVVQVDGLTPVDGPPVGVVVPGRLAPVPRQVEGQGQRRVVPLRRAGRPPPQTANPTLPTPPSAADAPPDPSSPADGAPIGTLPRAPRPHARARAVGAVARAAGRHGGARPLVGAVGVPLSPRPGATRVAPNGGRPSGASRRRARTGHPEGERRHAPPPVPQAVGPRARAGRVEEAHTGATPLAAGPRPLGAPAPTPHVERVLAAPLVGATALLGGRERTAAPPPCEVPQPVAAMAVPGPTPPPSLDGADARARPVPRDVAPLRLRPNALGVRSRAWVGVRQQTGPRGAAANVARRRPLSEPATITPPGVHAVVATHDGPLATVASRVVGQGPPMAPGPGVAAPLVRLATSYSTVVDATRRRVPRIAAADGGPGSVA